MILVGTVETASAMQNWWQKRRKRIEAMSKPGVTLPPRSAPCRCLRRLERHPACRRREARPGLHTGNARTSPAMPREKAKRLRPRGRKVPMRGRGADRLVVAAKALHGVGSEGGRSSTLRRAYWRTSTGGRDDQRKAAAFDYPPGVAAPPATSRNRPGSAPKRGDRHPRNTAVSGPPLGGGLVAFCRSYFWTNSFCLSGSAFHRKPVTLW